MTCLSRRPRGSWSTGACSSAAPIRVRGGCAVLPRSTLLVFAAAPMGRGRTGSHPWSPPFSRRSRSPCSAKAPTSSLRFYPRSVVPVTTLRPLLGPSRPPMSCRTDYVPSRPSRASPRIGEPLRAYCHTRAAGAHGPLPGNWGPVAFGPVGPVAACRASCLPARSRAFLPSRSRPGPARVRGLCLSTFPSSGRRPAMSVLAIGRPRGDRPSGPGRRRRHWRAPRAMADRRPAAGPVRRAMGLRHGPLVREAGPRAHLPSIASLLPASSASAPDGKRRPSGSPDRLMARLSARPPCACRRGRCRLAASITATVPASHKI